MEQKTPITEPLHVEPFDVDVVVPVRDGERYISNCIDSILTQSRPVRSVVVIDDGSTDRTATIVEDYMRRSPNIRLIRTDKRGLPHARNTGVANSDAPFVAFIDSDDIWAPMKLKQQMALFLAGPPGLGFVHCSYYCIDAAGFRCECRHQITEPRRHQNLFRDLMVTGNKVSGSASAVVVRREFFDRAGGFDERLSYLEDWDLWIRLAEICDLDFVPDALVAIRIHDQSLQHMDTSALKRRHALLQKLLILDKWYGTEKFPPELIQQCREEVLDIAMMRTGRDWLSGLADDWQFFYILKHCESRFGRGLFANAFDFVLSVACMRMRRGWRCFCKVLLKSLLPAQCFDRLKSLVEAYRRKTIR